MVSWVSGMAQDSRRSHLTAMAQTCHLARAPNGAVAPSGDSEQRRDRVERTRLDPRRRTRRRTSGRRDQLGGGREPFLELGREPLRGDEQVDLEEPPEAPGVEVARSGEHLL